jgi:hypothetical protein
VPSCFAFSNFSHSAGDTSITLSEPVNWKVGDLIALAPTGYMGYQDIKNPYNWIDQSDVCKCFFLFFFLNLKKLKYLFWAHFQNVTVTAVSGATVTFTPALLFHHHSGVHNSVEETGEACQFIILFAAAADDDDDDVVVVVVVLFKILLC